MLFGYLCILASRHKLFNDAESSGSLFCATSANIIALLVRYFTLYFVSFNISRNLSVKNVRYFQLSLVGLGGYTLFSFLCSYKSDCIEIHPYIVFVPVTRRYLKESKSINSYFDRCSRQD